MAGSRQGVKNVTMSWWVPVGFVTCRFRGAWKQRLFVDPGVSRLVESENVDIVVLVFVDDPRCVVIGVERIHENEGDIDVVLRVEVLRGSRT